MPKSTKKFYLSLLALLFILGFLFTLFYFSEEEENLRVNVYDIGQGDAIHIRMPTGEDVLIDGGPDSSILEKLGANIPFYDRTIEFMILTHPHSDHVVGLVDVLERYEVEKVLATRVAYGAADYETWSEIISEKNIPLEISETGQIFEFGEVKLSVLYPLENLEGQEVKKLNNSSVVNKLVFGETTFLFTGDAESEVEKELIRNWLSEEELDLFSLRADVLKAGHHGSDTSSSEEFVKKVSPTYAIISAGENNRFGHPKRKTLDTFTGLDIEVFRTDEQGDIQLISNGKSILF